MKCLMIAVWLSICSAMFGQELVPFRPGTELFADDANIGSMSGVKRTIHPATKLEKPVLVADKPWEKSKVYIYGTVLRDEMSGQFRMWYNGGGMAYAISDDGITWTKPELNLHPQDGKPSNLLTVGHNNCFVLFDPADPDPGKRYKALDNTKMQNFVGFYSADGIVWKNYPQTPLVPYGSEISNGVRDPRTGRYHLYIRPYIPRHFPKNVNEKRLVAVTTSSDFVNWSEPKIIISPDDVDDSWVKNPEQRTEFYGMSGFPYGNQYLGLLPVFRITKIHETWDKGTQSRYEGPIDAQLVTSRDGLTWSRTQDRTPVIPTGPGEFDSGCIMNVAAVPVIVGDEIFYYYTALNTTHGGKAPPKKPTIALARWRLDGFVSLDAGDTEGVIETKPLDRGGALEVNADASNGRLLVEVLDSSGKPIDGFSAADCTPVTTESVRHKIAWKGGNSLPADKPVKLRFLLTNGSIYSYTIGS